MPVNPNTATREEFTADLVDRELPANWPQAFKDEADAHKSLLDKLAHHSAMAPNMQQTFMTPAAQRTKIYFMWDFVGRTLGTLYMLNSVTSINGMNAAQKEIWGDVKSRAIMASQLILDTMPGMLNSMVSSTSHKKGNEPEFGSEILADARRLQTVN